MSKIINSIYAGMRDFSADTTNELERARTGIATPFLYRVIDLSVARTNEIHNISGDFLFCDLSSNGTATIELNNQMDAPDAPIFFAAGMGLEAPFKQIKVSNPAQAGAKLVLLYSTGQRIIPSSSMSNVNSILQPVNINDVISSQSQFYYGHATPATNNTPATSTIVAPASNVNGLIVRGVYMDVSAPSGTNFMDCSVIASASAPAALANGAVANATLLIHLHNNAAAALTSSTWNMQRRIPAGWGLYIQDNSGTTTAADRSVIVDYELL